MSANANLAKAKAAESVDRRRCIGSVVSPQRVELVDRVSEELLEVGFKEGDFVKKGQLLYRLNDELEKKLRLTEAKLEAILQIMGIRTMTAAVATVEHEDPYLTNASLAFHLRMGFVPVGTFHHAGCKFGRWYDLTWLEKGIGCYENDPPHPKTVHEILDALEDTET